MLAEAWRFPDSLHQAVAHHHAPADAPAESLANVVHIADAFAHAMGLANSGDELLMPVDRAAWGRLGLDQEKCRKAIADIDHCFEETCQTLRS